MLVNTATANALEYITERAADANRAFVPGAQPAFADVANDVSPARFVLDPMSVAPPSESYFITSDERERTAYTQNGALAMSNGTVVASNGRPVLGFGAPDGPLTELRIDPVDLALGRATGVRVDADGSVDYTRSSVDPRTGARENERVVIGRLALARFPAATKLPQADAERVLAPAGVIPHIGRPDDGNFKAVAPMHRASSRIDLDLSLSRLNDAYIAFDALQAAHKAQSSTGKTAMDLLK